MMTTWCDVFCPNNMIWTFFYMNLNDDLNTMLTFSRDDRLTKTKPLSLPLDSSQQSERLISFQMQLSDFSQNFWTLLQHFCSSLTKQFRWRERRIRIIIKMFFDNTKTRMNQRNLTWDDSTADCNLVKKWSTIKKRNTQYFLTHKYVHNTNLHDTIFWWTNDRQNHINLNFLSFKIWQWKSWKHSFDMWKPLEYEMAWMPCGYENIHFLICENDDG